MFCLSSLFVIILAAILQFEPQYYITNTKSVYLFEQNSYKNNFLLNMFEGLTSALHPFNFH